jgi:hypothetical protein
MKKFMFSAIAMIAFSVSSMANTISKDLEVVNDLDVEVISGTPCADGAMVVYDFLRAEMNLTHAQAWRLSEVAFNNYMKNTYN